MKKQISTKMIFAFCCGTISKGFIGGILTTYLMTFFIPTLDTTTLINYLPQAAIAFGIIRLIGTVFDAITDPWVANLSDRYQGKNGRRIPFMKWSAIPMAVFCLLIFFPPVQEQSIFNAIWVGVMMLAYYLFSTLYYVPYTALQSELTTDVKRRVFLYTIDSLMFVVSSALLYSTGLLQDVLTNMGVSEVWTFRIPFILFCTLGAIMALVPTFVIKEDDYVERKNCYSPILKSLKETFKYKNYAIMSVGFLVMWVAFGFFNAALMYYITTLIGMPKSFSTVVMGISIIVGVASYPLVNKLVGKFGKKPLLLAACLVYILLYFGIYMYEPIVKAIGGTAVCIILGVCIAVPIAITNIIPPASFADMAQYDTILTGENRAGMFVAARNFVNKLSQSVVLFIVPTVISFGNSQGTATVAGVRATALIAMISVAIAMLIYSFYDDKKIVNTINEWNEKQKLESEKTK
ncbi:MAG: MFS transporter [Clostridia bacterium]